MSLELPLDNDFDWIRLAGIFIMKWYLEILIQLSVQTALKSWRILA